MATFKLPGRKVPRLAPKLAAGLAAISKPGKAEPAKPATAPATVSASAPAAPQATLVARPSAAASATVVAKNVAESARATVVAKNVTASKPAAQATTAVSVADRAATLVRAAEDAGTRMAAAARADVALVKERLNRIAHAFYDVAEALVRLKVPAAYGALGYSSFHELCKQEFKFSPARADRLVAIATSMSREQATRFGQTGAQALVALCEATPEDDSPAQIANVTVKLPSGQLLDVAKVSATQALAAAKEIRAARAATDSGERQRGKTTTAEERAIAAELRTKLVAKRLERARVTAVATRPGQPADVRIERVPIARLDVLCAAICGKASSGKSKRR